ncbi:AraC family ligand binding domain-containing protein, partial [Treponema sp. R80B11-R83G3]
MNWNQNMMTLNDDYVPQILYSTYLTCQPEWNKIPHFLKNNEIVYIVKGEVRYTLNGKDYDLKQGDLFCLKEGVKIEAAANLSSQMQCYTAGHTSLYKETKSSPYPFPMVNHIGIRKELVDLFSEMTESWANQRAGYIMRTRALLMLIMNYLSEIIIYRTDKMTGDYRVNKAISFIASHYSDKITVKELAEK